MCEATITLVEKKRQVTMHEFALVCMHRCSGRDFNGSLAKMEGELLLIKWSIGNANVDHFIKLGTIISIFTSRVLARYCGIYIGIKHILFKCPVRIVVRKLECAHISQNFSSVTQIIAKYKPCACTYDSCMTRICQIKKKEKMKQP